MSRLILALIVLAAAQPALAQNADWRYETRHDGVHLRILRDYELRAGETAFEPIVVIGGSATINGRAEADVVVIGGTLRVGPTAIIRGDVATVGGRAIIDPAAQVRGEVDQAVVAGPDFDADFGWLTGGWWWWQALALGATILRLGIILIVAILLTVVAPDWVGGIARRISGAPLAAAGIGLAGQILFVPALVVITIALVVSVIGILLVLAYPILFGAFALVWVAGFAAVATTIGARVRGRDVGASPVTVGDLLIGFLLISAITVTAQVLAQGGLWFGPAAWMLRAAGWVVEWIAWTVALGGAVGALFGGRYPVTPPPLPYPRPAVTPS